MYIKKNDQQKIKTVFYTNTQIIKEYWFNITSTIKDIFNYFEKHIKHEGYSLKSNYKIFGKKINELYTIAELIKKQKDDIVLEGEIWIEAKEEVFFDDENDEIFYTILQPKINPFELIEYNPLKKRIKLIQCPEEIIVKSNLNKFSKESAFCNSINCLYISGGEVSDKTINNFWIINKNTYVISKNSMPIFKKYHSMLYIPDNYILIAGGDSLNTIIYDIENKEFIKWASMNKKHFQPGFFIYGDYVYAFSSLNDKNNNNNFFEKTNLTSKKSKWEKVYPKFDNNIKLDCHFFGISKYSEGNILFLGGEKNNSNYLYNPMDNILSKSNGQFTNIPFWDKTFYKISNNYNVCIPLNFNSNYKLAFLDKEEESLIAVQCDANTGAVNLNLEKDNMEGNVYIQSTIKNIKNKQKINIQSGVSPKNIMKKINKYNKNNKNDDKEDINNNSINDNNQNDEDIKFDSERIIIDTCYDNTENTENVLPVKSNKNFQKKSYLYISEYFVDDQIINREVDINYKNNKNNSEKKENNNKIEDINKGNNNNNENNNDNINIGNDYNEEDFTKEEYIFIGDLNGIDENEYSTPFTKKNISNYKKFLYVPTSAINDHIISRELILSNNEKSYKNNSENKNIINADILIPEIKIEKEGEEEEEKIEINYGDNYLENDDCKLKPDKNRIFLYVPLTSIDDNIINRKVEINEKINKSLTNGENPKPYLKKRIESNKVRLSTTSEKKNDLNLDNEILNGNEILNEGEIPNYSKTERGENNFKKYKNERKMLIPEFAIEDQIIKREILSDKKSIE